LGRKIAKLKHLTYTGTLGILVKSKQEGLLSRVAPVIEALRQTTMYLSPELVEHVLKESGELG
jgi:predicted nucleic acid-binding protein